MKNNQIALVLVGMMFFMSAGTVWLLWRYNSTAKEGQEISMKIELAKNTQIFMQQLVTQVVEFSKTHPDITPILQSFTNITTATVPAKPAAK